jgi:hypothetical protein
MCPSLHIIALRVITTLVRTGVALKQCCAVGATTARVCGFFSRCSRARSMPTTPAAQMPHHCSLQLHHHWHAATRWAARVPADEQVSRQRPRIGKTHDAIRGHKSVAGVWVHDAASAASAATAAKQQQQTSLNKQVLVHTRRSAGERNMTHTACTSSQKERLPHIARGNARAAVRAPQQARHGSNTGASAHKRCSARCTCRGVPRQTAGGRDTPRKQ